MLATGAVRKNSRSPPGSVKSLQAIEVVAKHGDVDIPDEFVPKLVMNSFVGDRIWDGFESVLLAMALFLPVAAEAQRPPIRVAVSSTSTIDLGELRRAFRKKCSNVVLNRDPSRADYALEAIDKTTNLISAEEVLRYRFTLFDRARITFYSTSPDTFLHAIEDTCAALLQQSASAAQEADAEPVNGLRMSISRSQTDSDPAMQFTITFSNVTRAT
jgi:hypothetical protein